MRYVLEKVGIEVGYNAGYFKKKDKKDKINILAYHPYGNTPLDLEISGNLNGQGSGNSKEQISLEITQFKTLAIQEPS